MRFDALLIANRGEIAIRIARAAGELGLRTVAIHSVDDADSLHVRVADQALALPGSGARAYLDQEAIVAAANRTGCGAIHPGYGFLAERADFARRCADAEIVFVGPRPEHLDLFGDKGRARTAAAAADVPVLRGCDQAVSLEEAREFFASCAGGAMIIKAVAGGGGRGTRVVQAAEEIEAAYARCRSEAEAAFGIADVYVEEFLPHARHVEVQIVGDLHGAVTHLGERECSVQRRHQKIVEVAPAPGLAVDVRDAIIDAAVQHSRSVLSILVLLLIAGLASYLTIPKESKPDINIPIVYVSMTHDGISPEDAERLLVRPMEQELRSIEGIKEMRSRAELGNASVLLEFEAGFDADQALRDRVAACSRPPRSRAMN